ncbi:MAG: UDP-N-acetylmuramoyl-tripeptide--D-alanyl-D-alanine ligase [Saprospiraceae bacterium]
MLELEDIYQLYQAHPNVCTDSRKVAAGDLFFALKGDKFDGNRYAERAVEQGAAYAIIDNVDYKKDDRYIVVDDALTTLQDLARFHRRSFGIPVIGLTGSNGKTTTKELIASVLTSQYQAHFTQGNFNNHIGVPLTLLAMPTGTQVAVIEMGANHVGEIDQLSRITEPTHGLITNIGKAHLEGFGGIEGVKKGKSELYRFIESNNGVVFISMDEPFLTELAAANTRKIFYKKDKNLSAQIVEQQIDLISADPYVKVAFIDREENRYEVQTQLIGAYNFPNISAAITIGKYFKVPYDKIKSALEDYVPTNNRSQIIQRDSNTIILDAYNANPTSMRRALDNLKQLSATKKVAILGDMLELGEESAAEHQAIYDYAQQADFQQLILVGKEFSRVGGKLHFTDVAALKTWFVQQDFSDTTLLIKGSRGIRLEEVLR